MRENHAKQVSLDRRSVALCTGVRWLTPIGDAPVAHAHLLLGMFWRR
jgi:hypothetical protein